MENVLLQGGDDPSKLQVKIIDFGFSSYSKIGNVDLSTCCGTIDFIAPEVFDGLRYSNKCDIWSIGVIAFFILSGTAPFFGKDEKYIRAKI